MVGRFVWADLRGGDPALARAFYGAVLGWSWVTDEEGNGVFACASGPVAGLPAADGAPYWVPYLVTAQLSASTSHLKVLRDEDVPGVGRIARCVDPVGAELNLFMPTAPLTLSAVAPCGTFCWFEHVGDSAASFQLFQRFAGWTPMGEIGLGPNGIYRLFGVDGTAWGGFLDHDPARGSPRWRLYVRVSDAEAVAVAIVESGGTVQHGPALISGGGKVVIGRDDQGAEFAVMQTP